MAPAIFQSVMDRVLHNLPVACYLDDILIAAPTVKEHDVLLERYYNGYRTAEYICEKKNVTLVKGKWSIWAMLLME